MNSEQQKCIDLVINEHKNVFLTGNAGTGKSYTVRQLIAECRDKDISVGVTSTTGVSAQLICGITVHSFLGLQLGNLSDRHVISKITAIKRLFKNWTKTDVLIIDEISMIDPGLFRQIIRIYKAIHATFIFVVVGDFFQLPPINSKVQGIEFCFELPEFQELFPFENTVVLHHSFRQSDLEFVSFLNRCRLGIVRQCDHELLQSMSEQKNKDNNDNNVTKMFSKNVDVDYINKIELEKLPGVLYIFRPQIAVTCKSTKRKDMLHEMYSKTNTFVHLKKGALVMLTKNMYEDDVLVLVNGSQGYVSDVQQYPIVQFRNGLMREIIPVEIEVIGDDFKCKITQVPLILAWALTIHKCQGATLDEFEVDLGPSIFAYGQAYVALSRCRTRQGIHIKNYTSSRIIRAHPKVLKYMIKFL